MIYIDFIFSAKIYINFIYLFIFENVCITNYADCYLCDIEVKKV